MSSETPEATGTATSSDTPDIFAKERLNLPDYYLYRQYLEQEAAQDTAETRKAFKRILIGKQIEAGIHPSGIAQKDFREFMEPEDIDLRVSRAQALLGLTQKYLEEKSDFTEAQRLAVLELFHQEAPLRVAKMNEAYFSNAELVLADLEAWAQVAGRCVQDLSTTDGRKIFISSAGESLVARTYLCRAGVALGLAKNTAEAGSINAEILKRLKKTAGIEVVEYEDLDKGYFSDTGRLVDDLRVLCAVVSEKLGRRIDVEDLNTGPRHLGEYFQVSSGERRSGYSYVASAAVAFDLAQNQSEALSNIGSALKQLKKIAGTEVEDYVELDTAYFSDLDRFKTDLRMLAEAVSEQLGKRIAVKDLNTGNSRAHFTPANGQRIKGNSYYCYAAVAYDLVPDIKVARSDLASHLGELKRIAGIEVAEYSGMDAGYFGSIQKVESDLLAIATEASERCGKTLGVADLNSRNINVKFMAANREVVSGLAYLSRAARAVGLASSKREAASKRRHALMHLKRFINLEIVEYAEMDKVYFSKYDNVFADLEAWKASIYEKLGLEIELSNLSLDPRKTRITFVACNNETVSANQYLGRAMSVFSTNTKKEVLVMLKDIAGIEIINSKKARNW